MATSVQEYGVVSTLLLTIDTSSNKMLNSLALFNKSCLILADTCNTATAHVSGSASCQQKRTDSRYCLPLLAE